MMLGLGLNLSISRNQKEPSLVAQLLASGAAIDLVAQAEDAGTITNTRTGARLSPTSGLASAANTVDYYSIGASGAALRSVNVVAGATNLVDEDLAGAGWVTAGAGSITRSSPETGIARLQWNGDGGTVLQDNGTVASGSFNRVANCQARLISGTPAGSSTDYMAFRNSGTVQGTRYALSSLTSEWQDIECSVTSASPTNQLDFRAENASQLVIEVRYMRATDTTSAMAPFEVGSSAGATYASDDINITGVTYPSDARLYIGTAAYHWSGNSNPETTSPRYFDSSNSDCLVSVTNSRVSIGGQANVAGTPTDSTTTILVAGWDGVNVTARYGDGTAVSIVSATRPSGTLTIGTATSIVRTMHANMFAIMVDQSVANLTDAEQKQLALELGHGNAFAWGA